MGQAKATGTISAPLDEVWAIVRDFGNLAWGGIPGVTLQGDGIGAVRTFTSRGQTIHERLETLDDLGHTLSYSIVEPSSIPWTGHLAKIALSPAPDGTAVEWSGRFEPRGLTEEQVTSIVRAIFENGVQQLKRAAEARRQEANA